MPIQSGGDQSPDYFARLAVVVSTWATQLVRSPPSQAHRAEAGRRLARNVLMTTITAAILIVVLMIWVDAQEIAQMPPRGTAGLQPFRILTDFGKDTNVLSLIAVLLLAVVLVAPAMHGASRRWLLAIGLRLQFVLLAIAVPLAFGELLKIGRASCRERV